MGGGVAADYGEDGHLDIVVSNEISNDAPLLRNASFDPVHYRRGDANGDGNIVVSDPVETLNYLFLGAERPGCLEAVNANGDGSLDLVARSHRPRRGLHRAARLVTSR